MNEWFLTNRDVIKNLSINTGTSTDPVWTPICCVSEIGITTDFESTDFYVFCDAIQRHLITGTTLSLSTTVVLDVNNVAVQGLLTKINSLISTGEIAQFNNQQVQFELLTGVNDGVLTYQKYKVNCIMNFSDFGGSAEEESTFTLDIQVQGKAEEVN